MTPSGSCVAFSSLLLLLLQTACFCLDVPENPCSSVVGYREINGKPVVTIKVKNDFSGSYEIVVNSTVPHEDKLGAVLTLENVGELQKRDAPELVFNLMYKAKVRANPRIKLIVFNDEVICKENAHPDDVSMSQSFKKVTISNPWQPQTTEESVPRDSQVNAVSRGERCGIVDDDALGYPWTGALFAYRVEAKNYEYVCTLTLISNQHAITAARCVQNQNMLNFDMDDLVMVFGKPKLDNWVQNSVLAYVDKVTVHPQLKQNKNAPDLAILTFTERIHFSNKAHPICLGEGTANKNVGVISGWDKAEFNQVQSTTPYQMNLEKVNATECKKIHPTIDEHHFCAGDMDSKGPCGREVGVAYMVQKDKAYYLQGIVALLDGQRSNSCENYTIFTDVMKEYKWIDSIVT